MLAVVDPRDARENRDNLGFGFDRGRLKYLYLGAPDTACDVEACPRMFRAKESYQVASIRMSVNGGVLKLTAGGKGAIGPLGP